MKRLVFTLMLALVLVPLTRSQSVVIVHQYKTSAPTGITFIQQAVVTAAGGSPSATISPAAGNSIIALISYLTSDTISVNPKLTGGSAQNLTQGLTSSEVGVNVEIWYLHNIGSSHTACTFSTTLGTRANINVTEWTGLVGSGPIPGSTATAGALANANPATNSDTTELSNILIIGIGGWTADDYLSGPDGDNAYTRLTPTGGGAIWQEGAYFVQSTGQGDNSMSWVLSAGINWAVAECAFQGS